MPDPVPRDWKSTIEAVTTPLGFLVLALLFVEAMLFPVAMADQELRGTVVWLMFSAIVVLALSVVLIAVVWGADVLTEPARLQKPHAQQFASDIHLALSGYLANLDDDEREEAWKTLSDVLDGGENYSGIHKRFRKDVSDKLVEIAKVQNKVLRPRGAIKEDRLAP
jgi:hypothetical protein